MIYAFVIFCALWRSWLGGLFRIDSSSLTALKHMVALAGVAGYVYVNTGHPLLSAVHALGFIALWRIYGHGPMLRAPLGPKDKDFLRKIATKIGGEGRELSWWIYAHLRYTVPSAAWAGAAQHYGADGLALFLPLFTVPVWYRLAIKFKETLPLNLLRKIGTPEEEVYEYHFAHFAAGLMAGCAIAFSIL